jgi:hypothetical protein
MRYRVKLINRLLAAKEFQTAYLEIGCYSVSAGVVPVRAPD